MGEGGGLSKLFIPLCLPTLTLFMTWPLQEGESGPWAFTFLSFLGHKSRAYLSQRGNWEETETGWSWEWQLTPVIPAFGKLRQEDFNMSLPWLQSQGPTSKS